MHFRQSLAAILAALACAPTLAQPSDAATVKAAATANNVAARYSPERLAAIRNALTSRVAVYDAAEKGMRAPTAAEAAALAPAASNAAQRYVTLRNGGLALRQDGSNVDYLIVDIAADGKKTTRHGSADSVGAAPAAQKGEHRHAH
jgi:hypothetical protein